MLRLFSGASALALFLCAPTWAQTKVGQAASVPAIGGGQAGTATSAAPPAAAPLTAAPLAATIAPSLTAPAAAPAAVLAPAAPSLPPLPAPSIPVPGAKAPAPGAASPADRSARAVGERFAPDGRSDAAASASRAFDGSGVLRGLPKALSEDHALSEFARDGAPAAALDRLGVLSKRHPDLRDRAGKTAVRLLQSRLEAARPSPVVAALDRKVVQTKELLARREYGAALEAAHRTLDAMKAAPIGERTRMELARAAFRLVDAAKNRGGAAYYGRKGEYTSADLAARVASLRRRDPSAYVGEAPSPEPVRVQCYGDCAVQQAYNHPRLEALTEQLPYPSFLAAVEAANGTRIRSEGLASHESDFLVRKLGLDPVRLPKPDDAETLAGLLRDHGALMVTVSWRATKAFSGGDHAVLLQGALREDGAWRFILIDSNNPKPQLYSFRDLQLLSPGDYTALAPLPLDSPYLPLALRGISDPAARLRAGAHSFIERFAVLRPRVPGWKRAVYGAVNAVRSRLGREELEPAGTPELDANAIPLDKLPAAARGLTLPPEALLDGPDGKRYVNRYLLGRLLKVKS